MLLFMPGVAEVVDADIPPPIADPDSFIPSPIDKEQEGYSTDARNVLVYTLDTFTLCIFKVIL